MRRDDSKLDQSDCVAAGETWSASGHVPKQSL